MAYSLGLELR